MKEALGTMIDASGLEDKKAFLQIYRAWPLTVGQKIAENTRVETATRGILVVNVSSPAWMQELQFLKGMILEKLEKELGAGIIRDIRFKTGPVPAAGTAKKDICRIRLDENEIKKTEKASAGIKDPEIREAFQHLMATHLRSEKEE